MFSRESHLPDNPAPAITTLCPVPISNDTENHVYVSVGHQQMMTDAMKPLGRSMWHLTTMRPRTDAGARIFVDVTRALALRTTRAALQDMLGRSDPLIGDALNTILQRGDLVESLPDGAAADFPAGGAPAALPIETDRKIVTDFIRQGKTSRAVKAEIRDKHGLALIDLILTDIQELKRILLDPKSFQVIMAGMAAAWWLNDHVEKWLGERNAADTLTQSFANNVTSEMGLALMDVAGAIRPHPDVVGFLQQVDSDDFLDALSFIAGGDDAFRAISAWLEKDGARRVGGIDIIRPRWSERPSLLVPMLLGNVRNFEHVASALRFGRGKQLPLNKEQELLARLRSLPGRQQKADETRLVIERVHNACT